MAKNTTGLFKRGSVYWLRYNVGGLQYRESAKTTRKEEAEALLAKRKTDIFAGQFFPEKKQTDLTMEGLRKLWLENAEGKASIDDDRQRFKTIVEHFGSSKRVASLLPGDVTKFANEMSKTKTRRGTLMSQATVNRHLALLTWALRAAERNGNRHRLPPGSITLRAEHNERDRICTAEEYVKLTEAASVQLHLAITIGYGTAMRLGEIAELTWDKIDLAQKVIRLKAPDTKTGGPRVVPLTSPVVAALKSWPRRLDGRVFNASGMTLSSAFSQLCKKLVIVDLHFHDLRHTALTNFRRGGVDLVTMKRISGHKTWAMLDRYQTVTEDDLRLAVDRLEKHQAQHK